MDRWNSSVDVAATHIHTPDVLSNSSPVDFWPIEHKVTVQSGLSELSNAKSSHKHTHPKTQSWPNLVCRCYMANHAEPHSAPHSSSWSWSWSAAAAVQHHGQRPAPFLNANFAAFCQTHCYQSTASCPLNVDLAWSITWIKLLFYKAWTH